MQFGCKNNKFQAKRLVGSTRHPTNYEPLTNNELNKFNLLIIITLFYHCAKSIAKIFIRPFG
jgi:hypothetical protein